MSCECANGRCNNSRCMRCALAHCDLAHRQDTTTRRDGRTRTDESDYQNRHRDLNEEHHLLPPSLSSPSPTALSVSPTFLPVPLTVLAVAALRPSRWAKNSLPSFRKCYPSSLRGRRFARVPHPLLLPLAPARPPARPGSDGLLKFACPSVFLLSVRPSMSGHCVASKCRCVFVSSVRARPSLGLSFAFQLKFSDGLLMMMTTAAAAAAAARFIDGLDSSRLALRPAAPARSVQVAGRRVGDRRVVNWPRSSSSSSGLLLSPLACRRL